jgi:hypothetical protein
MRRSLTSTTVAAAVTGLIATSLTLWVTPTAQGWANGNTAPLRTMIGGGGVNNYVNMPGDLTLGDEGVMYVPDCVYSRISAYPPDWNPGVAAPSKNLQGASTGLNCPVSVAFDAIGRMYVANVVDNSITVYSADWTDGDNAPIKTLTGASTGLNEPYDIAFDSAGTMFVVNAGSNSVTTYVSNWSTGNTPPLKTLSGPNTGLESPRGVAIDQNDSLYVANTAGKTVTVYAAGWASGDTAPTRSTSAGAPDTMGPEKVTFDSSGRMIISDTQFDRILVLAPSWTQDALPIKILEGENTGLSGPTGVVFNDEGQMIVANLDNNTITLYAPNPTPPGAPTGVSATGGNGRATVSWSAPVDTGGASVTSYTVIPSQGSSRCTWTAGPLSCVVSNLVNGQNYTFTVVATTEAGDGAASVPSPRIKPLPPRPTISAVAPSQVATGAPKRITITGTGFIASHMTVSLRTVGRKFGCTNITVVNATKITCTAPALTAGTYSVVVGFTDYPVSAATKISGLTAVRPKK